MHIDQTELSQVRAVGQARYDIYRKIHKAVRMAMAELLVRVGQLDTDDATAVRDIRNRVGALADLCTHHLELENAHIHSAMEARAPGSSERIAREHQQHETDIASLRRQAEQLAEASADDRPALAHALYHQLGLFIAHNLVHMYVEETANNSALWRHFSDAEIRAIEAGLIAAVPPETMAGILRLMVRATDHAERLAMFAGMKLEAPRAVFCAQLQIAHEVLPAPEWLRLANGLDEPVDVWGPVR